MVTRTDPLPVKRQCELLDLPRSTFYHAPRPVSDRELELMRLIDRCHLKYPFYGSRRIRGWLEDQGHCVNRKTVQRLMRTMDLVARYPRRHLSKPDIAHKIYPYLLRDLVIDRPNQVWSTDITYIPMARGFVYLVAVMDWYSRKVLSWRLSNTLDASFCVDALNDAIETYGVPEIFNTGGFQDSCHHFHYATCANFGLASVTGFSHTLCGNDQSRIPLLHRRGLRARAASYTVSRCRMIAGAACV